MNYFNSFLNKYELTLDEMLILLVSITVFLPFFVLILVFNLMFFYLLATKKINIVFENTPRWRIVLLFSIISLIVSGFYENLYGIGVSILIFQFFMFFSYYRYYITRKLFSKIINLYMILSLICFSMTIISVVYRKVVLNYSIYEFIEYLSYHRPVSVFFNTNYYATICEFIIIIAMYYFLFTKNYRMRILFFTVSSLSFLVLLLTENRTALPTILIASLLLSFSKKNKKVFIFLTIFSVIIIFLIFYSGKIFPRYEFTSNSFSTRYNIWMNSIELFKNNFLFGNGPLSYKNANFIDFPANHAHNILLDGLINYGIVGLLIIIPFFYEFVKTVFDIKNKNFFRLIISLTSIVILHGMFDVTIFWHQTAYIYFSIILATGKINSFAQNNENRGKNVNFKCE